MEEGLFHNPVFVNAINEYAVAAVGHHEGHQMVARRNPLTGADEQVCPHYGSIPCEAHQAVYAGAGNRFQFTGVPASFIALPNGEKFAEMNGGAPQQFIDKLNEAQQKIGQRPILGSQLARMEMNLIKGDQKAAQGKFKDALKAYNDVVEADANPEFVRARARERLTQLQTRAMAAVEAAAALEPGPAKRELKKLQRELAHDFDAAKTRCDEALAALEPAAATPPAGGH